MSKKWIETKTKIVGVLKSSNGRVVVFKCDFCREEHREKYYSFYKKKTHFCSLKCLADFKVNKNKPKDFISKEVLVSVCLMIKDKKGEIVFDLNSDCSVDSFPLMYSFVKANLETLNAGNLVP